MPYTSVGPLHTSYLLCTTFLEVKIVNPMLFMEKSKDQYPGSEHLSRHTGSEGRGKPGKDQFHWFPGPWQEKDSGENGAGGEGHFLGPFISVEEGVSRERGLCRRGQ